MADRKSRTTRNSKRTSQNRKQKSSKRPDKTEKKPNDQPLDDELSDPILASTPVPEVFHGCYGPLKRTSIRVMVLHNGDETDIRFDFETVDLAGSDDQYSYKYHALSYAWGEQFDDGSHLTHKIHYGDYAIPVTAHLHAGLKRTRKRLQRLRLQRKLWVDAICINQADPEERSCQVSMMGRIFERAYQTIIWLGEEDSDLEFSSIQDLCNKNSSDTMFKSSAADPFYDERHCVEKLFQRYWFKRRWTLQEYLLSESVYFLVGCRPLPAHSLADVARAVQATAIPFLLERETGKPRSIRIKPLVENMIVYNFSKCTLPHDCVYALLGISSDGDQIKVDYTKPVTDLYVDVTSDFILVKQDGSWSDFPSWRQHAKNVDHLVSVFTNLALILDLALSSRKAHESLQNLAPSWMPLWSCGRPFASSFELTTYSNIYRERSKGLLTDDAELYEDMVDESVALYLDPLNSEIKRLLSYNLDRSVVSFQGRFLVLYGIVVDPQGLDEETASAIVQDRPGNSAFHPLCNQFDSTETLITYSIEDILLSELDQHQRRVGVRFSIVLKSLLEDFDLPKLTEDERVFLIPGLTFALVIKRIARLDTSTISEANLPRDKATMIEPNRYTLVNFLRPKRFVEPWWPRPHRQYIGPNWKTAEAEYLIRSACTTIRII